MTAAPAACETCHAWRAGRLFTLCARIHALDALKAAFRAYIKKAGLALIMDEEKARPFRACFDLSLRVVTHLILDRMSAHLA